MLVYLKGFSRAMNNNLEEVIDYINNSSISSKIYVGCDSRQTGKTTTFVTVVVVHLDGNKGGKCFSFLDVVPRIKSLKWRLIQEAHYSTYRALELKDRIGEREIEVHLDYHPSDKHKSNSVVKEAVGFVIGQGLNYQLKPLAHAATSAGDFLGRHGGRFRSS